MNIHNGDTVTFRNVRHGSDEIVEGTGTVNGAPLNTYPRMWPIYTERDHGREATTIYVRETNIVRVHRHSFRAPRPGMLEA